MCTCVFVCRDGNITYSLLKRVQKCILIFGQTAFQVRVYTAKSVFHDLKVAKEEFIQATVYVHKQSKVYLPKILHYYAKDMSLGMAALLEALSGSLPQIQQKAIAKFLKGRPEKYVYWLEQSSSFRYLIHREIAERGWGA